MSSRARAAVGIALAVALVACASPADEPAPPDAGSGPASPGSVEEVPPRRVLAVSVDGLASAAVSELGPDGAPAIWELLDEGAGTLDGRTAYEMTVTLPNHVGMVTGRRIDAESGGHGVDWNDDTAGPTVPAAADGAVPESIFTRLAEAGGTSTVLAGKVKFEIFSRTWPDAVDVVVEQREPRLATRAVRELTAGTSDLVFLHLARPDVVGHEEGWESTAYLDAVRSADAALGRVLAAIDDDPALRSSVTVVLTADHGGNDLGHQNPGDARNYTVPFVVRGDGVAAGDLYELAPGLGDPGDGRPTYDAPRPPVRNCDLANVAALRLGLEPVPDAGCVAALEMREPLGVD